MKQKVLIFINSLSYGGAERVVSHLLNHLKDDFEIHLALYKSVIDYQISSEVKIFDLGQALNDKEFKVLAKIPWLAYRLNRYCKENQITTSVAFLNRPCYINALMRSLWGFKGRIIMCERTHQTNMLKGNSWLYRNISRQLVKFSYKRADLVLTNSYVMKSDLEENFGVKTPIEVIHNPIDIDFIKSEALVEIPLVLDKNIFYFIAVGGFRKEKNYPLLLNAFFHLKHLPVKLLVVGGGSLEKSIYEEVSRLGLQNHVEFCGFDKNPFKYVSRAQCFIITSYVEGFPNVVLEALACGKPVISTDCKSGPREILAPGTDISTELSGIYEVAEFGILTPVTEVEPIAKAMIRVYEDRELRKRLEGKSVHRAAEFDIAIIKEYFHTAFATSPG